MKLITKKINWEKFTGFFTSWQKVNNKTLSVRFLGVNLPLLKRYVILILKDEK